MAEYCSQCSPFKDFGEYDVNLQRLAIELDRGHSYSFICEGCANRAIYKDESGFIYLYRFQSENQELVPFPVNLGEL